MALMLFAGRSGE